MADLVNSAVLPVSILVWTSQLSDNVTAFIFKNFVVLKAVDFGILAISRQILPNKVQLGGKSHVDTTVNPDTAIKPQYNYFK